MELPVELLDLKETKEERAMDLWDVGLLVSTATAEVRRAELLLDNEAETLDEDEDDDMDREK